MRTAAVIVTHESGSVLPGLLEGLATHEPGVQVVVVDSGSGTPPKELPVDVTFVALEENVGFGTSVNRGVARCPGADVVAVLNPDVRLQAPSLSELAGELSRRPHVGIATGPVVGPSGRREPSAWGPTSVARAAWFATGLSMSRTRRVLGGLRSRGLATSSASMAEDEVAVDGHVLGGAMVVRRECWEQLGGFDEDYFLYWEDADLCHRARQLGWEVAVLPCAPIVHEAGTSSEGVIPEQRWNWYYAGAELFARKHLDERQRRRLLAALRAGRRVRRVLGT